MARKSATASPAPDDDDDKTKAKAKGRALDPQTVYQVPEQNVQECKVVLVGTSPLISNKFSHKAMMTMLLKQLQVPEAMMPRPPKDPVADFEASIHKMPDGSPAIPGGAFKASFVGAVRQLSGTKLNGTNLRQFFHVIPHLVRIHGDDPQMIMHVVRNETGVADIRFRAIFLRWLVEVPIRLDADLLGVQHLLTLAGRAGFGCGIGDWRASAPKSASGRAGAWRLLTDADGGVERLLAEWRAAPEDPAIAEAWGVVKDPLLSQLYDLRRMGPEERIKAAEAAKVEAKKKAAEELREAKAAAKRAGAKALDDIAEQDPDAALGIVDAAHRNNIA